MRLVRHIRDIWCDRKLTFRKEEEGAESTPTRSSDITAEHRVQEVWLDFSTSQVGQGIPKVGYRKAMPKSTIGGSTEYEHLKRGD